MKRLSRNATPAQRAAHKTEWAEYVRLRNKPEKACVRCHRVFPNTDAAFERSAAGWLTSTCRGCSERLHAKAYQERANGAAVGMCPICRERGLKVVRDMQAPHVVWLCRRCIVATNMLTHQDSFDRFVLYMRWKNGWSGQPVEREPEEARGQT